MKVAAFWPVPHDGLALDEVTTDEDAERYDAHGHPIVTISADLAVAVGFAFHVSIADGFREMHEIQVDATLPPRSWHAGPRRAQSPPAKPRPHDCYDFDELCFWLASARAGARNYVVERFNDDGTKMSGRLDIPHDIQDMCESPSSYEDESYSISDLEWLRGQVGDLPRIHYQWKP